MLRKKAQSLKILIHNQRDSKMIFLKIKFCENLNLKK